MRLHYITRVFANLVLVLNKDELDWVAHQIGSHLQDIDIKEKEYVNDIGSKTDEGTSR